jgi:hypothetical protein
MSQDGWLATKSRTMININIKINFLLFFISKISPSQGILKGEV